MDAPTAVSAGGRSRSSMTRAIELAPLVLVVLAEAAWISVLGGLLQEFALRRTVVGIPVLAGFVAAGVIAARLLGPRLGDRWPVVAVGLGFLAAAIGWAIPDDARAALGSGLGPALASHPGGLVCGLALIRGYAHARLPLAEDTVTHLLTLGIPGVALVSLMGGLIGEPFRSAFLGEALGASIVFVAAGALALAFTRLDEVGLDGGFDWRRNPPWLVLTVGVLVLAIALAIPLAAVAGTVLSVLISLALGPLLVVGLASGFDRTARRVFLFFGLALAVIYILAARPLGIELLSPNVPVASGDAMGPSNEQVIAASLGGLLLVAATIAFVVLIALWMRRNAAPDTGVDETRAIDRAGDELAPSRRRSRFGRRPDPVGAVEAYVALVDDLERHADVRRETAETPTAHAARLRGMGRAGLSLELLAADYGLARYGGVALTAREDRRAVGRWRSLRRQLVRGSRQRPGATAAETVVPQAEIDATEGTRTGLRPG